MPFFPVRSPLVLIALAATAAVPALARHHPASHNRHATAKTHKAAGHGSRAKPLAASAPHGAVSVPAGGLKVYCQHRSPLLVRKMTQGAGTTVTVLCR